ncbi:unnamed protein product, partial [Allacma fusca]
QEESGNVLTILETADEEGPENGLDVKQGLFSKDRDFRTPSSTSSSSAASSSSSSRPGSLLIPDHIPIIVE